MLIFNVRNQSISRIDNFSPAEKSKNYLEATFNFKTEDWNGATKTAVFENSKSKVIKDVILSDDKCIVPWEVLEEKAIIKVSVYGITLGEKITTDTAEVNLNSTLYGGSATAEPTPDVYQQIIDMISNMESGGASEEQIKEAVDAYMEENPIGGVDSKEVESIIADYVSANKEELKGDAGGNGEDGISPTIEVNKVDGVTTLTITDAEGVKTATISDGSSLESVNIFKGINWCAIGDSYTWGDPANEKFTDRNGTEYSLTATTWLANEIEANLTQVGLGGAHLMPRIVDGEIDTTAANYVTNPSWWYGMKNITANTNLITIQLGLNDNGHELFPIGQYGDETVMTSYGAFKVLMDKINEVCPLAKVGLIVSDAWLSTKYAKFLYDVSTKYNLPILDLNHSTVGTIYGTSADDSYNYNFADSDTKATNNLAYRVSSTNGHPNTESHKLRAEKLRGFLKYLMYC